MNENTTPEHIAELARHIANQAEAIADGTVGSLSGAAHLMSENVETLVAWVKLHQQADPPRRPTANDVTPDQLVMLAQGKPPRTEHPTLPMPRSRRDLVNHLVSEHGLSRFDLERSSMFHLRSTHGFRHSVEPGQPLVDHGNQYDSPSHRHPMARGKQN